MKVKLKGTVYTDLLSFALTECLSLFSETSCPALRGKALYKYFYSPRFESLGLKDLVSRVY